MEDNLNLISSATKLMALFNAGKEALPSETVPLSSALTLFDGEAEVREKALADMEHTRHLQKPHAAPAFAPELNFGRVGWRRSSSEKDVRPASEGSRRSVAAGSRRHMSLATFFVGEGRAAGVGGLTTLRGSWIEAAYVVGDVLRRRRTCGRRRRAHDAPWQLDRGGICRWRRSSSEKDVRPASEGSRRSVAAGSR